VTAAVPRFALRDGAVGRANPTTRHTKEQGMIEIRDGRLGKGVATITEVAAGTVILRGWGPRVPQRTRHSIQVDRDTHVVIPPPIAFLNHSCAPNCGVLVRNEVPVLEIHALTTIAPGEELTIDYATFESEIEHMTGPCLCGAPSCRGRVTGYRDLTEERRAAYGPYVAPYLREIDAAVAAAG
jgi:hypothetical protein